MALRHGIDGRFIRDDKPEPEYQVTVTGTPSQAGISNAGVPEEHVQANNALRELYQRTIHKHVLRDRQGREVIDRP